jgi:hypothetical protein
LTIRSLDLLDLPTLYRHRGEAVSFDTARALTRGNPLGAIGLLAYMNPQRHVYSAVSADEGVTLLGGIIQTNGDTYARLLYLAPASDLEHASLPGLIESLCAEAGSWGAFHVLAELEEASAAFAPLRRAGFSVYAGQRMWDASALAGAPTNATWPRAKSVDLTAIQNLHHQIVPPLLQAIEPAPKRASGFICSGGGLCHASTSTGLQGVVVFPLIHPDATDVAQKLAALIQSLPNRGGRQVYVCVRTYQAWLEHVLEDLGAKPGPQQAIMVKHMTRLVKDEQAVLARQPARVSVQASRVSRIEEKKQHP